EQQDAIANSFATSRQATNQVTCSGAGVMWQWTSNLRIQRASRVEDISAGSLLTVCAPIGVKPASASDPSWDPDASAPKPATASDGRTFPLAGGAVFERDGEQVRSP